MHKKKIITVGYRAQSCYCQTCFEFATSQVLGAKTKQNPACSAKATALGPREAHCRKRDSLILDSLFFWTVLR